MVSGCIVDGCVVHKWFCGALVVLLCMEFFSVWIFVCVVGGCVVPKQGQVKQFVGWMCSARGGLCCAWGVCVM